MAKIRYDRTPPTPPPRDIDEGGVYFAVTAISAFLGAFPSLSLAQEFVEDRARRTGSPTSIYSIYPIIGEDNND